MLGKRVRMEHEHSVQEFWERQVKIQLWHLTEADPDSF